VSLLLAVVAFDLGPLSAAPRAIDTWFQRAVAFMPRLLMGLLAFAAFWIVAKMAARLIAAAGHVRRVDPDAVIVLEGTARAGLIAFGVVTALGTMGVDVSAMVAALGLTGFALGFALKDVVSNLVAGILVLIFEPFERGEVIDVGGKKGVVREINLRYTVLETEAEVYLVPNSSLVSNVISITRQRKPAEER
jgi:small-conductance mechanosensitive channel